MKNAARGVPIPTRALDKNCEGCRNCVVACPTRAIALPFDGGMTIDYGACLQCGLCVEVCPTHILKNSGNTNVFALNRSHLVTKFLAEGTPEPKNKENVSSEVKAFRKLTGGRGFLYREVAASGNNLVECELNATFNPAFDSESLGIRAVASPKHADALVFSGPVGEAMERPLSTAWSTIPDPKVLIACGTEAISGGLFPRGNLPKEPDLFIAGDPPRPDTILAAFLYLIK
jgi:Ni,Fe-hydrogenase III small subunit/Pyruvate/2-oxoacid:ferredoxin oxidoreductase delta subunit